MGLRLVCLVEQPDHPRRLVAMGRWQELARRLVLYKSKCVQGSYGAPTKKPTSLYSNHTKFVLCNKLSTEDQARIRLTDKQLVTRKRLCDGRLRVTGIPSTLKSTQAYTPEFGQAIVRAWQTPCVPLLNCVIFYLFNEY